MDTDTFIMLFFGLHIALPFIIAFAIYLWKGYH